MKNLEEEIIESFSSLSTTNVGHPTVPRTIVSPARLSSSSRMDGGDENDYDYENENENENEREEEETEILKDRFRLSAVSIVELDAKRNNMEVSEPVMACITDLAFQFTEQLAKDLELFALHAGRKSVNMEDVILSTHRNEQLGSSLRSICLELKGKEPQSDRKRKKASKKEDNVESIIS